MDFNSFERRFVINLPNRTDRRRDMESQLRQARLSAEFFPAFRFDTAAPFHNLGFRGAFMSHLAALRIALGSKNVLMMEDDLDFVPDYLARAREITLPRNWAIFYGSYNDAPIDKSRQTIRTVSPSEEFIGCHFYAVNGPVLPSLVSAFEVFLGRERDHPLGGPMSPDGALNVFRQQNPRLAVFAAHPALGYQRSSRSDCAEPRWFDHPITAPVINGLRKIKNHWR